MPALAPTSVPPPQQPPPTTPPSQQALTAAVVLVMASGAPPAVMAGALAGLLAPLGVTTQMLAAALSLLHDLPMPGPPGTATAFTAAAEHAYRAAYLLAACRRLLAGGTVEQERVYARQHVAARHARRGAAAEIDATVKASGTMLIWRAVRDSTTTAGCAAADGMRFDVAWPPVVEGRRCFPGQVHAACRCVAAPSVG